MPNQRSEPLIQTKNTKIEMNNYEILEEIQTLHKVLKECILTDVQRITIRNEIGELQDALQLDETGALEVE
jgi:hypothetical protein